MIKKSIPKVLVIDDSIDSIVKINELLFDEAYSIRYSSGVRGYEMAVREKPGIIVLNIVLKEKSGLKLLRELKKDLRTKHIPVIVLTEVNTSEYWQEAYDYGAVAYLVKGLHLPWLAKKIRKNIINNNSEGKRVWFSGKQNYPEHKIALGLN